MKKILFIIPLLTAAFLFATSSFAQQSSSLSAEEEAKMKQMASEMGITFPIAELNNCAGPKECHDFCNQESNRDACTRFAKKYGFDKKVQQETEERKDAMLQKAKDELSCNSQESCSRVCEQNQEKCQQFARRHGYSKEDSRAEEYREKQKELVENARSEFGCNSQESCNSFCQKEENREKCKEFARRQGFNQGETRHDEDGARPTGHTGPTRPTGPGGCRTEEECRRYYQEQRPNTTTYPQPTGGYNYPSPSGYQNSPTGGYNYPSPSDYQNSPTGTGETTPQPTHDPSTSCTSYPGCSWTGTTCDCSGRVQGATTENPYDFHFQYIIEIQNLLHQN